MTLKYLTKEIVRLEKKKLIEEFKESIKKWLSGDIPELTQYWVNELEKWEERKDVK